MVALAIRSGIAYEKWLEGDPAALATALELLEEQAEEERRTR